MEGLSFELTITKTGILLEGGTELASPFVFKGNTTLINTLEEGVGFQGSFYTNSGSQTPVIIDNVKKFVQKRMRVATGDTIGGMVNTAGVLSASVDNLSYTIDENFLKDGVKAKIAAILGVLTTDIS